MPERSAQQAQQGLASRRLVRRRGLGFVGAGDHVPALSKLGGGEWERAKGRVKQSVAEVAQQLIALYAARDEAKAHAFGPDTTWQRELEEAFPFVETPDQLVAIDDSGRHAALLRRRDHFR